MEERDGPFLAVGSVLSVGEPVPSAELFSMEKVFRIGQDAVDICNKYRMAPRELIPYLEHEILARRSLQETATIVENAVRKVTQVEGVMLHGKQREFFKELFASLMKYWAGEKT